MKIKFLEATTLQEYYEIDDGSVYTKCKNETLDSATICISNIQEELNIEPLDRVVLIDEKSRFDDIYLCIDTINRTDICVSPKIYRYDIQLISETKKLEGIILPNLTITPTSRGLRVYDYISRYMELYGPKIRKNVLGTIRWVSEITLDIDASKFNMDCPEMQWNTPTLREVLNDLMMVADCIPVVRNNTLSQIDLTEIKRDISNEPRINYVHQSKSLEDYVSELKVNLINGMQENKPDVNTTVRRIELAPFTSDEYLVNSENMILKTQFPILKIISLKMAFGYKVVSAPPNETETIGAFTEDLCNFDGVNGVYEEKEFRTLPKIISNDVINSKMVFSNYGKYQNFSVYYSRGSNYIGGFSNLTEQRLGWISENKDTLTVLKNFIMRYRLQDNTYTLNSGSFYNTYFIIEYEAVGNSVFSASKSDYPRHKRTVVDNQTNSYINVDKQGFLEYQKANRLGNLMRMINARYNSSYNNIIKIGDVYNDSIVYQCQYQIYKSHIEVNAQATKDYVLRDYFTGVKAKLRSWKIVDGSEAQTRHEHIKYYCELSYNSYTEVGLIKNTDLDGITLSSDCNFAYQFARCFETTTFYPIGYCGLKITTREGTKYPSTNNYIYLLEVLSQIVSNSLVFTFGCNDNFGVDKVPDLSEDYVTFDPESDYGFPKLKSGIGGYPLKDLRYVDANGECLDASFVFLNEYVKPNVMNETYKIGSLILTPSSDIANYYRELYEQNLDEITLATTPLFFDKITLYKDNKEILKWSYQFEFYPSTEEITIGKALLARQRFIHTGALNSYTLYSGGNSVATSSDVSLTNINKSCCQINISFFTTVSPGDLVEIKDDETDELILSFIKKGSGNTQTLYLNFLKDRNKTVYE